MTLADTRKPGLWRLPDKLGGLIGENIGEGPDRLPYRAPLLTRSLRHVAPELQLAVVAAVGSMMAGRACSRGPTRPTSLSRSSSEHGHQARGVVVRGPLPKPPSRPS